jgi:hypothetical protein
VSYDFHGYPRQLLGAPTLKVSMPGNGSHKLADVGLYPYYSVPLSSPSGTINIPVSALAGAGTYTIWIDLQSNATTFPSDISDLAFTRVDAGTARPPAPLLSLGTGSPGVHTLDVPYKTKFTVSYDVSHIPGATGAIVELAAAPPSTFYIPQPSMYEGLNTFRNPNGNALDDDGVETGSLYHIAASGVTGSVTIDPTVAAIPATVTVNVRVLPTSGRAPIAEASDIGTITYHGIESSLGGPIDIARVDPGGSDGYLQEAGSFGPPQANLALYTIEPFDVGTGTNGGVSLGFTNNLNTAYPIVENDVALAVDTLDFQTLNYYRAAPLAAGFSPFAFPPGSVPATAIVSAVASNSSPTRSAYLAYDVATGSFIATRGDIATGTGFAPPVDVTTLLDGAVGFTETPDTFAYNPTTDRAYILAEDDTVACNAQSPRLVSIDFGTGTATARQLTIGGGFSGFFGYQMALDPATGAAAIATSCQYVAGTNYAYRAQLSLVNLDTGATTQVFEHTLGIEETHHGDLNIGGGASAIIEIDPVNHLILQRSMYCPTLVGFFDMNQRPCLNEYDETGRLVKTIPNLFPSGPYDGNIPNGVNGMTRTGVALGQQPGPYTVESFEVQPFTY